MKRWTWIWMAGCMAWLFDGVLHVGIHQIQHAILAFLIAAMFAAAWLFYSRQHDR